MIQVFWRGLTVGSNFTILFSCCVEIQLAWLFECYLTRFTSVFSTVSCTYYAISREAALACRSERTFSFLLTVEAFQVILQLVLKLLMWFEEIRCLCNNSQAILKIELENESRNLSNRFYLADFLLQNEVNLPSFPTNFCTFKIDLLTVCP